MTAKSKTPLCKINPPKATVQKKSRMLLRDANVQGEIRSERGSGMRLFVGGLCVFVPLLVPGVRVINNLEDLGATEDARNAAILVELTYILTRRRTQPSLCISSSFLAPTDKGTKRWAPAHSDSGDNRC
ncbi:hypothetical protein CNMCM8980_005215 [Aspergillus fumigatiaffinis]|nr:hypothetical protein CNMCM8980_005215 [Aspergillus fumigatiaffinis]